MNIPAIITICEDGHECYSALLPWVADGEFITTCLGGGGTYRCEKKIVGFRSQETRSETQAKMVSQDGNAFVVEVDGISLYIDLTGRVYRSAGGHTFMFPQLTDKRLLERIAAIPEIKARREEVAEWRRKREPKRAPQPPKRFLP